MPDLEMQIRDFDLATDLQATSVLFCQLGYPTDDSTLRARIRASTDDPAQCLLVAEDQGRVVGVLAMHVLTPWHEATHWAVISALVVDEAARSHGAGAMLLSAAEQVARAKGCSQIELSSSESRIRAHAFYERAGFKEVRKRFVKRICL